MALDEPPWSAESLRKQRAAWHLRACAMLVLEVSEDEAQGCIMDYIIVHESEVSSFMLNEVPMYVAGWKAAMELLGHNG